MERIREWLNRRKTEQFATETIKSVGTDLESRTARATNVTDLQAKVSRLQQEMLELSNADGAVEGKPGGMQMADLEAELDKTQRELGKIQGRI